MLLLDVSLIPKDYISLQLASRSDIRM